LNTALPNSDPHFGLPCQHEHFALTVAELLGSPLTCHIRVRSAASRKTDVSD
jgi:hypothetical protein